MPERHDAAIFLPSRPSAGQAVTSLAEEEETGINKSLTREWVRGEAFYGGLGDSIHIAKVLVAGFLPGTNLSFQVVNESSVMAEALDEYLLCRIDFIPSIAVVPLARVTTREYRKRLPSNAEYSIDVRPFECVNPITRSWVSLETRWYPRFRGAGETHQVDSISKLATRECSIP